MKHFFLRLIPRRLTRVNIACFLAIIVAIWVGVYVFISIDTIPASDTDYKPLEEQSTMLQNNFEMITKTNCNIYVNDGLITVTFQNDECKLIAKYDSDLNLIESSREDKYEFWLLALFVALILAVCALGITPVIFALIIEFFEFLCKKIFKTNKHEKDNS